VLALFSEHSPDWKSIPEFIKDMLAVGQYKPWNWAGLEQQSVIKRVYI